MDLLNELRQLARTDMPRNEVLVSWFTRGVDAVGSQFLAHIRDVFVVMLRYEPDKSFSRYGMPVTLSIMPLIWHNNKVHIGGSGWRRLGHGTNVRYLAPGTPDETMVGVNGKTERPIPVGWFYLLFDSNRSPSSLDNCRDGIVRKAIKACVDALKWNRDDATYGDRKIGMPMLLAAKSERRYLKLRDCSALDEQILSCACSGVWKFPSGESELVSGTRGSVDWDESLGEMVITPESKQEDMTLVSRSSAECLLEVALRHHFGEMVKVNLQPTTTDGHLQLGQPLFRPIEKKEWTLPELKARADWPVLAHLAAFTTSIPHADDVRLFDTDMVVSGNEPWVDARRFPVRTRIVNRLEALKDNSPTGYIDLVDLPLRRLFSVKDRLPLKKRRGA
jgi:hypothetical protein